jgi:hypothetical protein
MKRSTSSGKQVRAGLGELHINPGLVLPQPTLGDREGEAGAIFGWGAAFLEQERPIDLLDMDAAILDSLDSVRDLEQLAGGLIRICERSIGGVFHQEESSFPVFAKWPRVALFVMPIRHDVNSPRRAAFGAEQVGADARPRLISGQGVEPDVDHALAVAVEAPD